MNATTPEKLKQLADALRQKHGLLKLTPPPLELIERANRTFFERLCKDAGVSTDRLYSPLLTQALKARETLLVDDALDAPDKT